MKDPKSFVLRLAFALGIFDAMQMAVHHNITPLNSAWQLWTTVYLMPFAFYWLIFWPVRKFAQGKKMLTIAWVMFFARITKFIIAHLWWGLLGGAAVRFGIGLAVCAVVIFIPMPALDRILRKAMPIVVVPALLCMVVFMNAAEQPHFAAGPSTTAPQGSPNILLVSWDTVRADVLPMYGGTMLPMPNLQQFADRSIQFQDAVAHAPITGPSHASMLTGVVPPMHGIRSNVREIMPDTVQRLPEVLRDYGYHAGGFVAAYPLRDRFGFGTGFEVYDDRMSESFSLRIKDLGFFDSFWLVPFAPFVGQSTRFSTLGSVVQERAFDWVETLPEEEPYFMFLHLYDAHGPWNPVGKYKEIADAGLGKALPLAVDPIDAEPMARYRGDVAMMDDFLAEMLQRIEVRDPGLKNTVILLTADHGECFGEGGFHKTHTESLYEATQHVPMFLYLPNDAGAGVQVEETVTHSDIFPTLLAAAGVDLENYPREEAYALQQALSPGGMRDKNRSVYMEAQHFGLGKNRLQGWRTQEWKRIQGAENPQLSHLWKFRENEVDDFLRAEPDLAAELLQTMFTYFQGLKKINAKEVKQSAADGQAMDALGYAGSEEE